MPNKDGQITAKELTADGPKCVHDISVYARCMECWPEEVELDLSEVSDAIN